uniref:R3H domain-containing protein n=1 Tax=Globodera rostochiensis TaxID=31243 RepID=A0A914I831_GLORO
MDLRQASVTKRKHFLRSDAMVADEDAKLDTSRKKEVHEYRRSSIASNSKDSFCADSTGVDILRFIEETLHKNAKDRDFLLDTEQKLRELLLDESQSFLVFPSLSSYNRMLVHRAAAFFGLLHNVDQSGQKVVVTKLPGTKLPDIDFEQLIKHNDFFDSQSTRRNVHSFDETKERRYPMREFRSRFNTASSEGINGIDLARNRRARSFEIDNDWYAGFQRQHLALHRYSATIDYPGGGDGVSSNCSSSASSTAISAQMLPLHLSMLQATYANSSNEASMISPASAYSEPAAVQQQTVQCANHQSQISSRATAADAFPNAPNQFFTHPSYYPVAGYRQQTVPPFVFSHSSVLSPTAIAPNYPPAQPLLYYPTSSGAAFYQASASAYQNPFTQSLPLMEENGHNLLADQFGQIVLTENSDHQGEAVHSPLVEEGRQLTVEGTMATNTTGQTRQKHGIAIGPNDAR